MNNLSDPLETLQREWPAIKSAPWAFGGALTVLTALAWGLIHWIYRTRLETRKDTIEHLEAEIERLSEKQKQKPQSATPAPLPDSKAAKARPCIEVLEIKPENLSINEREGYWETAPFRSSNSPCGLVITLYYRPGDQVRRDLYLKAHLCLTDKDSMTPTIVPAACWIKEPLNRAVLQCGDTKPVLLLALPAPTKDERLFAVQNELESTGYFDFRNASDSFNLMNVSYEDKRVELTLMEDEDGYKQTFHFDIEDLKGTFGRV